MSNFSKSDDPHSGQDDQSPELVPHPVTGDMVTPTEWLDDVHGMVRNAERDRQAKQEKPPSVVLSEEERAQKATELLDALTDKLAGWKVAKESLLEDGGVVRDYRMNLEDVLGGGGITGLSAQLIFINPEAEKPSSGNATVYRTVAGQIWPREFFMHVTTEKSESKEPGLYTMDYPYHEEDMVTPERNTNLSVFAAEDIINQFPSHD